MTQTIPLTMRPADDSRTDADGLMWQSVETIDLARSFTSDMPYRVEVWRAVAATNGQGTHILVSQPVTVSSPATVSDPHAGTATEGTCLVLTYPDGLTEVREVIASVRYGAALIATATPSGSAALFTVWRAVEALESALTLLNAVDGCADADNCHHVHELTIQRDGYAYGEARKALLITLTAALVHEYAPGLLASLALDLRARNGEPIRACVSKAREIMYEEWRAARDLARDA